MSEAEALCSERGARFTPLRKNVLELIWQSHKAVKAYDLIAALSEKEGSQIKPPTVYRSLDFLIEEGFVHKIESLNAYVGCPHPSEGHVGYFMICDACETVFEMDNPVIGRSVADAAQKAHFKITEQIVEVHGRCQSCAA